MREQSSQTRHPELVSGFAFIALLLSGCAGSAPKPDLAVLPPEVIARDPLSRFPVQALRSFNSEPLWTSDALEGYEERYRMTIYSISFYSYQVTVDRKVNGATSSRAKTLYQDELIGNRRVIWRNVDYANFKEAASAAALWNTPDERWESPKREGSICVDGTEVIFERLDRRGYAISQGNISCDSVPDGFFPLFSTTVRTAQLKNKTGGVW